MKYTWKIDGVTDKDGLITQAKYHCCVENKGVMVDTEGTWFFREPKLNVPFAEVTESLVIDWIRAETSEGGISSVEKRLAEQIESLAAQTKMTLPWMPQTFTPKI